MKTATTKIKTHHRAGRPTLPAAERQSERVTIRLTLADAKILQRLCRANNWTMAELFRYRIQGLTNAEIERLQRTGFTEVKKPSKDFFYPEDEK
jgi:hypothetical protein